VTPPLWLVLIGLELPAVVALLDCFNRPADHFDGGAQDRTDWLRWLLVGAALVPVLLGYGILLGYYYVVIRRNQPGSPR